MKIALLAVVLLGGYTMNTELNKRGSFRFTDPAGTIAGLPAPLPIPPPQAV